MIFEDFPAGLQSSSQRRNDNHINMYTFHILPRIFTLLKSVFCNTYVHKFRAEFVSNVSLGLLVVRSKLLLEGSLPDVVLRLGMADEVNFHRVDSTNYNDNL